MPNLDCIWIIDSGGSNYKVILYLKPKSRNDYFTCRVYKTCNISIIQHAKSGQKKNVFQLCKQLAVSFLFLLINIIPDMSRSYFEWWWKFGMLWIGKDNNWFFMETLVWECQHIVIHSNNSVPMKKNQHKTL